MTKFPNFFIAGIEKSGTTSLYEYLKLQKLIYMPSIKEPWYFAPNRVNEIKELLKQNKIPEQTKKWINEIIMYQKKENYLRLFEKANINMLTGEASAVYWNDKDSSQLIFKENPDAKIIFSIRNPVNRIFSGYKMLLNGRMMNKSFHEYVFQNVLSVKKKYELKEELSYYKNLKRYFDCFGKDQIKIVIFEEWTKNPLVTINEILSFLGIPNEDIHFEKEHYNKSKEMKFKIKKLEFLRHKNVKKLSIIFPKSVKQFIKNKTMMEKSTPIMLMEDKKILMELYKQDIKKLENLIGRKQLWREFTD